MEITISGNDRKRLQQVIDLAKKLGLQIYSSTTTKKKEHKKNGEELYKLMTEKAKSGGIKSIKDPLAWQKEQRKDKPLYGRKE